MKPTYKWTPHLLSLLPSLLLSSLFHRLLHANEQRQDCHLVASISTTSPSAPAQPPPSSGMSAGVPLPSPPLIPSASPPFFSGGPTPLCHCHIHPPHHRLAAGRTTYGGKKPDDEGGSGLVQRTICSGKKPDG